MSHCKVACGCPPISYGQGAVFSACISPLTSTSYRRELKQICIPTMAFSMFPDHRVVKPSSCLAAFVFLCAVAVCFCDDAAAQDLPRPRSRTLLPFRNRMKSNPPSRTLAKAQAQALGLTTGDTDL